MNVYLDDMRGVPDENGIWRENVRDFYGDVVERIEWLVVRTVPKCIALLAELGEEVKILSLDHDLGWADPTHIGYDVVTWIEERVFNDPTFYVPEIRVHSQNFSEGGVKKMLAGIESIKRMKGAK